LHVKAAAIAVSKAADSSKTAAVLVATQTLPEEQTAQLPAALRRPLPTTFGVRPHELAYARGAALLDPRAVPRDAIAVVKLVYDLAAHLGMLDSLRGLLVKVPANGHVAVTDERPTVNPQGVSTSDGPFFILPATDGGNVEPLTVVTIMQTYESVSAVVRDILAAIVASDSTRGSTGVARSQGLAACPGDEMVSVPGGALVTLSMLVLLLYRQKDTAASSVERKFCVILKT
jgi:hypothetical protein